MSNATPSRDKRKSFRCAVADSRQQCKLKVGEEVLPATLIDESAGGFAVLVDRPTGLNIDQIAELYTDMGWCTVRLIHATQIEPDEPDNPNEPNEPDGATDEEQSPRFRLGFVRLDERELLTQPPPSLLARGPRRWRGPTGVRIALGVLLAIVVVVLPMGLMGVPWHTGHSKATQLPAWKDWVSKTFAPGKPARVEPFEHSASQSASSPFSDSMGKSSDNRVFRDNTDWTSGDGSPFDSFGDAAGIGAGRAQISQRTYPLTQQNLQTTIHRMPGAMALTLPEVVEMLQLTNDQKSRIGQLIEVTSKAIRDLDTHFPGQQRQQVSELREHLLEQSRREAIELLTSQQRAEWEKLVGTH